ncbi:MAG: YHS domain-containing (seleno)protein [Pseudomonadota bacterium]
MHSTRRQFLTYATGALAAPALIRATPAFAATAPIYANDGIAIDGTDAVGYFTEGQPVAGNPAFTHEWNGATWRFMTGPNRDSFAANPETYAPQFGGYCAWAVAQGYTAPTAPEAWSIHKGKLYLNYSRRIRRRWERDIAGNVAKGRENWPAVLSS